MKIEGFAQCQWTEKGTASDRRMGGVAYAGYEKYFETVMYPVDQQTG